MNPAIAPISSAHLALLGTVVFLANAGLLVLQLLAGRYLAPFIGSSVETWTSVIGVFLTGIALGNHFGGKLADRSPTTKTLGKLLLLGAASSFTMMLGWFVCKETGIDQAIPLGPRIPILAALFCFLPGFVLSLLTPLTIKLMLADVTKAGRVSGIVFAVSTLGCLLGNYATGFWLMANLTLNVITVGVAVGLCLLAIPMFVLNLRASQTTHTPTTTKKPASVIPDDPLGFRRDIRRAFAVVFIASFCGMSLELTASRVLAPVLGVSLYTWTGIIGVMLAGTACGNYIGGVIADRGATEGLKKFALLLGLLVGFAATPAFIRTFGWDGYPAPDSDAIWIWRVIGSLVGTGLVLGVLYNVPERAAKLWGIAAVGAGLGYAMAHPIARSLVGLIWDSRSERYDDIIKAIQQPGYGILIHLVGAFGGGAIAVGLAHDPNEKKEPVKPAFTLAFCLFCAGLFATLVVVLSGMFQKYELGIYRNLRSDDLVWDVLTWTFLLFFLPMFCLGLISPQVIRLSITDTAHAGRTAGTVYAWSTAGAIAGTFTTGFFLIDFMGVNRVLFTIGVTLLMLTFVLGKLWRSSSMLFLGSILLFAATVGMFVIGYQTGAKDTLYYSETKYYTIKVTYDEEKIRKRLTLDLLIHSSVDPRDPLWLGYQHEEIQGELVRYARAKAKEKDESTDILVIGGGAYTFPRWVETMMPDVGVDVVEIDPGVTKAAEAQFGLSPKSKSIRPIHMDGRQFVREKAKKGHYKLVIQDAVNDLSVPYHLLTKEYNDAVKATLAPDGAYLLTIIDSMEKGHLWRAAIYTMRESFKYVEIMDPSGFRNENGEPNTKGRHVYVIYGADHPLELNDIRATAQEFLSQTTNMVEMFAQNDVPGGQYLKIAADILRRRRVYSTSMEQEELEGYLKKGKKIILTDQYAPVDNLMGKVFLDR